MTYSSRISPAEPFPKNLRELDDQALHVLNSKLHRELDAEYRRGAAEPETEFRSEEVNLELDWRESQSTISDRNARLRS
ncbi:hypothetical protein [Arthrobacter sp. 260]|uniref:hypothetical protein n=1 Tax=Arthrobacter sp. 260 TaxID=2735314 RepID=UPI0014915662|nr:hypothetical protein [Arthrobacter sp. 260]NOJ60294.1 hypothetical protein [Arthrobacter sp. 260]